MVRDMGLWVEKGREDQEIYKSEKKKERMRRGRGGGRMAGSGKEWPLEEGVRRGGKEEDERKPTVFVSGV